MKLLLLKCNYIKLYMVDFVIGTSVVITKNGYTN